MRFSVFLILWCVVFSCYSQENTVDSLKTDDFGLLERNLFYTDLFNFSENSLYGGLIQFNSAFFTQPLFPETNWTIDFSTLDNPFSPGYQKFVPFTIGFNPFYGSFNIMNQARYQINDKLSIGGNSYAGSSIFDPMPMNRPFNERDIKGASMFLEYKVSKKFKIETRVSVNRHVSPLP